MPDGQKSIDCDGKRGEKLTSKEYLQEIRKLDRRIDQKQIEYDSLYKMRGCVGGTDYSFERVQTSPDGQGFTKISDKLLDLQKEINAEIDKFCVMRHERIKQIQQLSKVEYIDILFKRYVEYKSFETISCELGYVYNYTCQLHGMALEEFELKFLNNLKKFF